MTDTAVPTWTNSGECLPVYEWEAVPSSSRPLNSGKQAANITLMRKRLQGKGVGKELFVCKWYATAGVRQTSISGPKYIHREWKILSGIHHPNIVAYEDFSYNPSGAQLAQLYLEYCPEGDLSYFVKHGLQDNRLPYCDGVKILEQMTQALLYIHHGIYKIRGNVHLASPISESLLPVTKDMHSDWVKILQRHQTCQQLTDGLVFIYRRFSDHIIVKLGDFGIAKFETEGTDTYVGSRDFLAPEQRNANQDGRIATAKSDIYALGVSLAMITNLEEDPDSDPVTRLFSPVLSPQRRNFRGLLDEMTQDDQHKRPESAAIIDAIRIRLQTSSVRFTMLEVIVQTILDWDTSASRDDSRKKAKRGLLEQLKLCHRWVLAKSDDDHSQLRESLLLRAINFMNRSFEALDLSESEEASYPSWKALVIGKLLSLLRKHGFMDSFLESNAEAANLFFDFGYPRPQFRDSSLMESFHGSRPTSAINDPLQALSLETARIPEHGASYKVEA